MSGSCCLPDGGGPGAARPSLTASPLAGPPALPPRPGQQNSMMSSGYGGYSSPYGNSMYGNSMYGGSSMYGGGSSMYGNSMYGGYGGGSGMYGGGYGGLGGYNRFGAGNAGGNYVTNTFVRRAEESSQQAFQSIESIVQAFGSVTMMLESTFSAVYNSFRAVIGVADHFSRLKTHFAQIFSAFALIRTLKWLYRKMLVWLRLRQGGLEEDIWSGASAAAAAAGDTLPGDKGGKSNWPVMLFFAVVIGGPWLIWKFLSSLATTRDGSEWANGNDDHFVAVAQHDFDGENEELSFRHGQRINIAPKELQPKMRGWLLGSVDGEKVGIIPANYVKIMGKRRGKRSVSVVQQPAPVPAAATEPPGCHSGIPTYQEVQSAGSPDTLNQLYTDSIKTEPDTLQAAFSNAAPSVSALSAGATEELYNQTAADILQQSDNKPDVPQPS